jgi:hypothetical protein
MPENTGETPGLLEIISKGPVSPIAIHVPYMKGTMDGETNQEG